MKLFIYDLEVLALMFYGLFYDPETKAFRGFEISAYRNDLFALVKFLDENKHVYLVGYNCLNYDSQILEYIIRNYEQWSDLTGDQIATKLSKFSGKVIEQSNYGLPLIYKEYELSNKQIDLFKIHHFDNESRRVGLKWLQYMMDWWNVEEMPYHFADTTLTRYQLCKIIKYCQNDVLSTYQFYLYTIGEVSHPMYMGKNKIEDRMILIEDGLLPPEAINYSDSKIGDEMNKRAYCRVEGIKYSEIYNLKKNRKPTKPFTFGEAIPDYVQFKTPEFQAFRKKIDKERVGLLQTDKKKYPFSFRGTDYVIARGGIHSVDKPRSIRPKANENMDDADVGAQYPNAIRKRRLFPVHLGPGWNAIGIENIGKKDQYKQEGKKATDKKLKNKLKGLETTYKLMLNSGYYGKTGETTNWQYGPEVAFFCTIGNQFEILMLIEMLELVGIHCISANTDGIVCLYDKSLESEYYRVCGEWEKIVGNDVQGKLEYTHFEAMYQESVNHYIGIKKGGEVKVKGRFSYEDELHKNNSDKISRIERKAIVEFFSKGTPIEKTIKEEKNPFMFLIGKKASKDYRWETMDKQTGEITEYKHLIRFYVSTDGEKLLKMKNEDSDADGVKMTQFFKEQRITIRNKVYENEDVSTWNIDYQYYIDNIQGVISAIEVQRKNKNFVEPPKEQLGLF